MKKKNLKKSILKIGYLCNNNCLFCRVSNYRKDFALIPLEKIKNKINLVAELGTELLLFSGGEPTVRKDFFNILQYARESGFKTGVITNARVLSYPSYLDKLIDAGIIYIHTSLHGSTNYIHNFLVRDNSFENIICALSNLRKSSRKEAMNIELHVNTVINKKNYMNLTDISDVLSRYAPLNHKMSLMEPEGSAIDNKKDLFIMPSVSAEHAIRALKYVNRNYRKKGMTFGLEGFSLCHIKGYEQYVDNLFTHNIEFMSEGFEDEFFPVDHGHRVYPSVCTNCSCREKCPGVYEGYLSEYGDGDLKPNF